MLVPARLGIIGSKQTNTALNQSEGGFICGDIEENIDKSIFRREMHAQLENIGILRKNFYAADQRRLIAGVLNVSQQLGRA